MKQGITPVMADFTVEAMNQASSDKRLHKELAAQEPTTKDLGKFDPDYFDTYKDAFLNLLKQKYSVLKKPLAYIVRPKAKPQEFVTAKERHMFELPLTGNAFELDNHAVYHELKAFFLTLLVGPGLNPMMLPKMAMVLSKHGPITITAKANSANILRLPRQGWTKFTTRTNAL